MISNPMEGHQSHDAMVMGELSPEVFDYFFARSAPSVFGKTRGVRQALIATFFQRFYEECKKHEVLPQWDPEQDLVVEGILSRLNFNAVKTKKKNARPQP